MTELEFSSEITVNLIRHMAHDAVVVQAAQVSVKGKNKPGTDPGRLINYLMQHRHGSPFEHAVFTFFVEAPLFVFREWQRHRMSSFNEMSGRYTTLPPKFYVPFDGRLVVNNGTSARPSFKGDKDLLSTADAAMRDTAEKAWEEYDTLLKLGVANEVARMVLPVNIYSQMYWTVNARSLMNFLSLRIEDPTARIHSRPQIEIQKGAEKVENYFAALMPETHLAFIKNGRVAP